MFYIVYVEYQLIGQKNEYDMGLSRNVWFLFLIICGHLIGETDD